LAATTPQLVTCSYSHQTARLVLTTQNQNSLPGTEAEKTNLEKRASIEEAGRRQGKKASAILSESKFI
jgi:hypothetical protein